MDNDQMTTDKKTELKNRVDAEIKRLESEWNKLKADGRSETREREKQVRERLDELRGHVASGFSKLTDKAADKINALLR